MTQPQLEYIPTGPSQALVFKIDRDLWPVYHYHPEFDILLSLKDHAGQFISGDHIGTLRKGTLIMNGPNIPHALHSGLPNDEDWTKPSLAVVQFSSESLGAELLEKTEMQTLREFLREARFGFEFHGSTAREAADLIMEMADQTGLDRFLQLLRILDLFANTHKKSPLASPAYSPSLKERDISRLDEVLNYLRKNKTESVSLEQAASIAKMSPKSFCRFFKANTGETLTGYLNELRIGEACQRLLGTNQPVSEIAFDCGFNNLSNFNRRFQKLRNTTPRDYRREFRFKPSRQNRPLPELVD